MIDVWALQIVQGFLEKSDESHTVQCSVALISVSHSYSEPHMSNCCPELSGWRLIILWKAKNRTSLEGFHSADILTDFLNHIRWWKYKYKSVRDSTCKHTHAGRGHLCAQFVCVRVCIRPGSTFVSMTGWCVMQWAAGFTETYSLNLGIPVM